MRLWVGMFWELLAAARDQHGAVWLENFARVRKGGELRQSRLVIGSAGCAVACPGKKLKTEFRNRNQRRKRASPKGKHNDVRPSAAAKADQAMRTTTMSLLVLRARDGAGATR